MKMTTDESSLREKMGQPEGPEDILELSDKYDEQQDIERRNDNSPEANEIALNSDEKYVVNIKKHANKSDKETI
jgi:hypothetical protein